MINLDFLFCIMLLLQVCFFIHIKIYLLWTLGFIKLFIMDNIVLNPPKTIEQKFVIIGFGVGNGHQYE